MNDIEIKSRDGSIASCPNCRNRRQRFREAGLSAKSAQAASDIEETMGFIRRSMAKRELLRQAIADLDLDIDMNHVLVVHAIHMGVHVHGEVTVGLVAEHLGIDPSRASRLVADTVDAGLARRVASQADARRICLELTDRARAYEDAIHAYKALVFSNALHAWEEAELVEFARLFKKFSNWLRDGDNEFAHDKRITGIKSELARALK